MYSMIGYFLYCKIKRSIVSYCVGGVGTVIVHRLLNFGLLRHLVIAAKQNMA